MTRRDHGGGDGGERPRTPESRGRPSALDKPAVSRVTLARRLRAVERALGDVDGIEIEPGSEGSGPDDLGAVDERLDAVTDRLDALCRAIGAIGECLDARDRARRSDDGIEAVRRAVEALPDGGEGTRTTGGDDDSHGRDVVDGEGNENGGICVGVEATGPEASPDGEDASVHEESPTEWLDRVAAGGVAPPPVE